jgi:hypothetical protein
MPCPNPPPTISPGGWLWYDIEFSRYKCPNGYMFEKGNYPYWYSNCTIAKTWDPTVIEKCVRKFVFIILKEKYFIFQN